MKLFTDRDSPSSARRPTLIEELELLWRRARKVALFAPVLLFVGFGAGKVTSRSLLVLPDETPVRVASERHVPRVHLEGLSGTMQRLRGEGVRTADYVNVYNEHVAPVERVLRRRGVPRETARRMAWPLVEHTYARQLDLATVVSIVLIESNGRPDVTSVAGARGLMQVMPLHKGQWQGCGDDMFDIENNICYGTSILAWLLGRFNGDERRALLAYNGCVRGSNTPNCHTYPAKVHRIRDQIQRDWERLDPETYESVQLGSNQRAE